MYLRSKFITNSSSTSVIGWGVYITAKQWDKIDRLPDAVQYARSPWDDDYIVYINHPEIHINEEGIMEFPPANAYQEQYRALKGMLESVGVDASKIGYIEESWYDG